MSTKPSHPIAPGSRLEPDMAAFDEDANPWLRLDPRSMPEAAESFLGQWRDPDAVVQAFPEVRENFFPFLDPRRRDCLTDAEAARGIAKAVVQMHSGLPRFLVIEAAADCQLSCPFCSAHDIAGRRRDARLRIEAFRRLWRHAEFFTHSLDFTGGEPLLNPDLAEMIALARRTGVHVSVSTNGLLLDERRSRELLDAGLSSLVVSCDGADRAEYEAARAGGDFNLLLGNIARFADLTKQAGRSRTRLGLRFLVTRLNIASRERFRLLAGRLGADFALIRHFRLPPDADPERRDRLLGGVALENHPESAYGLDADGNPEILDAAPGCGRSRHPGYVGSGGELLACAFFPRGPFLGNVVDRPFAAVWLDRENIARRRDTIRSGLRPECRLCPGVWRPEWYEERWYDR